MFVENVVQKKTVGVIFRVALRCADQEEIERKKRKRLQGFDDNMYGGGMSGGCYSITVSTSVLIILVCHMPVAKQGNFILNGDTIRPL